MKFKCDLCNGEFKPEELKDAFVGVYPGKKILIGRCPHCDKWIGIRIRRAKREKPPKNSDA